MPPPECWFRGLQPGLLGAVVQLQWGVRRSTKTCFVLPHYHLSAGVTQFPRGPGGGLEAPGAPPRRGVSAAPGPAVGVTQVQEDDAVVGEA